MSNITPFDLLKKVREQKPVVHHLTNWVTIYDCANIVKVFGASPVMAHSPEESADMSKIASALVLNIGTLTSEFIDSMKLAAKSANEKGIPVILDVCGAGATKLRDSKCFELIKDVKIDIIKGNVSEVGRIAGLDVATKGVDAVSIGSDARETAENLAKKMNCTVVITGEEDIVTDGKNTYKIKNGHSMMGHVVGTGCMATSVIGTFAAIEKDFVKAAASGLCCYEVAAELAVKVSEGPGSFKNKMYDAVYNLDQETIETLKKIN